MKPENISCLDLGSARLLSQMGEKNLLVGIPSFNCAHTIGYVLYQVARGLTKYFPDHKSLILVSDGGSQDGTAEVVEAVKMGNIDRFFTKYVGISGKGSAVRAILEAASILNVEAVAMFDSDLRSITPEWCKIIFNAIMNDADLVTPLYIRHKFDGTITNNLCYPFTRAVYGFRIRQPIGGDFGLSNSLVTKLLESPLWDNEYIQRFGIDIFITHSAIAHRFSLNEAFLGSKVHEGKDPGAELTAMFCQVVGSMFTCTKEYEAYWRRTTGSRSVHLLKCPISFPGPEPVIVDSSRLLNEFRGTVKKSAPLLREVLQEKLYQEMAKIAQSTRSKITPEMWAKTVYSFACNFKKQAGSEVRNKLLESLRGLWLGKVYGFILETEGKSDEETNLLVERDAEAFEDLKMFLLSNYPKDE